MFCFVDYRISDLEKNTLEKLNLNIIKIPKCDTLYDAINGHVDIQVHILDKESKTILINKNMPVEFKKNLSNLKIKFIESYSDLGKSYPFNIGLNAFSINNYFIHNLKHTDKNLLSFQESKELINVKQGYTKCSCLPISENAFITNDKGLYKSLIKYNFDILYLPPGDITLDGFDYGFIGGTGGLIDDNTIAFFGHLDFYKYGDSVKEFLNKYNVKPIYLKNDKLTDRGSLFVI